MRTYKLCQHLVITCLDVPTILAEERLTQRQVVGHKEALMGDVSN